MIVHFVNLARLWYPIMGSNILRMLLWRGVSYVINRQLSRLWVKKITLHNVVDFIQSVEGLKSNTVFMKKKKFSPGVQGRNPTWVFSLLSCGIQSQDWNINSYEDFPSVDLSQGFQTGQPPQSCVPVPSSQSNNQSAYLAYCFCFSGKPWLIQQQWKLR